jgi:hypothetical protein
MTTPGTAFPVIDPVGGVLIDPAPGGQLYGQDNDKTFSNEGAAAIVQYELPGWQNLYYFIQPDDGGPFGFRFSFVVQDANGTRVSATGGLSINLAGTVGGKLESTTVGSAITLLNINETQWMATSALGTWTVTAQVTNSVAPAVTPAPTISTAGATLSCTTGTWSSAVGTAYYQWYSNGLPIHHATSSTYATGGGLAPGTVYTCRVSIIDTAGTGSVRVVSNTCTVV